MASTSSAAFVLLGARCAAAMAELNATDEGVKSAAHIDLKASTARSGSLARAQAEMAAEKEYPSRLIPAAAMCSRRTSACCHCEDSESEARTILQWIG
eukprot:scaffold14362_cov142-Isochrysis_galbana.AAC.3